MIGTASRINRVVATRGQKSTENLIVLFSSNALFMSAVLYYTTTVTDFKYLELSEHSNMVLFKG